MPTRGFPALARTQGTSAHPMTGVPFRHFRGCGVQCWPAAGSDKRSYCDRPPCVGTQAMTALASIPWSKPTARHQIPCSGRLSHSSIVEHKSGSPCHVAMPGVPATQGSWAAAQVHKAARASNEGKHMVRTSSNPSQYRTFG